jgi:transcriptional regulator with XRE-family HTH domain
MPRPRKKPVEVDEHTASSELPVGRNSQKHRKRRGLTQEKLAEKIGVTREAIAAYETGRVHLNDSTLIDVAVALRVPSDEILGLKDRIREELPISRRLMKRMIIIEGLPEAVKKRIILTLDDSIKANTHSSILDD